MLTGFKEGAIEIGEVMKDECIKIYSKPKNVLGNLWGKLMILQHLVCLPMFISLKLL